MAKMLRLSAVPVRAVIVAVVALSMAETLLARAKSSFKLVKAALQDGFLSQSEQEITFKSDERRIQLRFDADPTKPALILVQEDAPNLVPDLVSDEIPERETKQRRT